MDGGEPRQHVDPVADCRLQLIEIAGAADSEVEVARLTREFVAEQVDLTAGPLFAAKLFRCASQEHVLILGLDHAITDLTSNAILFRELWTLYEQGMRRLQFQLPELPLQYADYAVWQQRSHRVWSKEHEAYWRQYLAGAPPTLLPIDGRGAGPHPVTDIPFGHSVSEKLRALARCERTLLPLIILTVYVAALAVWCNQRDLVIKFVAHARYRPELQNMVGFLANNLFLRVQVSPDENFHTLLEQIKLQLRSAYAHADFDRVPDLIPECVTELGFNWVPAVSARPSENNDLRMQPYTVDPVCPHSAFTLFADAPTGIVAKVWCKRARTASRALDRFGYDLRRIADECAQRALAPLGSIASSPR